MYDELSDTEVKEAAARVTSTGVVACPEDKVPAGDRSRGAEDLDFWWVSVGRAGAQDIVGDLTDLGHREVAHVAGHVRNDVGWNRQIN